MKGSWVRVPFSAFIKEEGNVVKAFFFWQSMYNEKSEKDTCLIGIGILNETGG